MSVDILMRAPMTPLVIAELESRFTLHKLWEQPDGEATLAAIGPRIRGLASSTLGGPVTPELLDRLPALEIIAHFGVGYDEIDAGAAAARKVVVTNTPGVLDDEVADLAIGLLVATLRQIPQADRFLRAGQWRDGRFPLSSSLRGRRIGILGLGNIGHAIARRLEGFGVEIAYHTRHCRPEAPYAYYSSPVVLAEACDTLIVIVPGGDATRGMINGDVLKALGPAGVLINVARGSVVDQSALIAALVDGTILTAGLDVYTDEPNVPQALIDMPQVVLLPHIASASEKARVAMGRLVVDNLVRWFEDGRPLTPVPESEGLLT